MSNSKEMILTENDGAVRTITLNRPNVLNAFNKPLSGAMSKALQEAGEDNSVRCLVITGAGRAFCSGQDLVEVANRLDADDPIEFGSRLRNYYNPVVAKIRAMEKPVIAAVNGVAAGAGCSLAVGCDLRIAADTASFIQAFVSVGLVPDVGSTFMLPRLIGVSRAMDMAFTGRKVSAEEALRMGLVNQVVPGDKLQATVNELAQKLAALPTRAIGLTKRAINAAWNAELESQLDLEAVLQAEAAKTHDHREGVAAFVEKRKPQFRGE